MMALVLGLMLMVEGAQASDTVRTVQSHGGIVRMDTTGRSIYLLFTGHEYAEGGDVILRALKRHNVKASFFLTGDFYRNPAFRTLVDALRGDGHYLGPHSDRHLLYVSWEDRDSLLVTRAQFLADLDGNLAAMDSVGVSSGQAVYFMPAYEWYNDSIAAWCRERGRVLVNFTPGTSSNADYTTPDMGSRYVSSDSILTRILRYERLSSCGLNGFLLLTHIGTSPARSDKFYTYLDTLISALKRQGYQFRRLGKT